MTDQREGQEALQARRLAKAFRDGTLSRRQLIERAGLAGVGLTALSAALSNPVLGQFGALTAAAQATGEITIASDADIDTLDPHISQLLVYGNQIRFTVFNGLVKYAPDLSYVGDLAESWTNPDDKTYVFTLREGLTYHDGTPVLASDVQFSYERAAGSNTIWASRVANIASYDVTDERTITITLADVQADFLDGIVPVSIISPAIAEACFAPIGGATPTANAAPSVGTAAIGTGPFKFVSWTPNDNIQLEANPNYHEAGVPGVSKLTFKILTDPQVTIANVQSGTVNAALKIPVAQAAEMRDSSDVTPVIVPTSSFPLIEMLGKNNETIRGSAKVRQALAHCLNKDLVQQVVYSGEGQQKWTFVGSSHWAYKEEAGYPFDPAAAKALLDEEGVSGLEFTCLCITEYPEGADTATIWQAGLAEAGVTLNIEVQAVGTWLDSYLSHEYDVIWNVFPGFADPNYFVSLGLEPHFADGWTNTEAQQIATQANQTVDQAQRTELYGRLQDLFVADLPVIVVQEAPVASLTQPNITGWNINPLGTVFVDQVKVG